MYHGARYGYRNANKESLGKWAEIFGGRLGTALTDTYTTEAFFRVYDTFYGKLFDGLRHDSGDPFSFGHRVIEHYEKLGIDPRSKTIVFSDGLDSNLAQEIHAKFAGLIKTSFGIGTNFTNDVGVKPLSIVVKLTEAKIDGIWTPTIKLSDVAGKHMGPQNEIDLAKGLLRVD